MFTAARKFFGGLIGLSLLSAACAQPAPFKPEAQKMSDDKQAPFNPPETYPEWAYDQPEYNKPVNELEPEPRALPNDPLHYFTKDRLVMVRQPAGYDPEEVPRIALWWTDDNGYHWHKGGFFGRSQTFFPFETKTDGDYGVRFVGPGQPPAEHTVAYPERVYHVDTVLPEVEVWVSPEQTWYNAGDMVTISWRATDPHLVEFPVRIGMLMDFTADDHKMVELQRDLADEGSLTYTLPPDVVDHEIWFRVEALDRADNLGLAYSFALQVVDKPLASDVETIEPFQPTSSTPAPDEATLSMDVDCEPRVEAPAVTAAELSDIIGDCDTIPDIDMTVDEARVVIEQAAIEFDALVSNLLDDIRTTADRGRSTAAANEPHRVIEIRTVPTKLNETEQADTAWDEETTSTDVVTIAPPPVYNARAIGDAGADAPCNDESAVTPVPASTDANIGQMSLASGGVPFATAASRTLNDDPAEVLNAPSGEPFKGSPLSVEPRTTAVVAFNRNRPLPAVEPETTKAMPSDNSTSEMPQTSVTDDAVVEPPAFALTYQLDGWTFAGIGPDDDAARSTQLTAFDPTFGNGLLVPFPATIETPAPEAVASRPWQSLDGEQIASVNPETIWIIPRQTENFAWRDEHEARFLADNPAMRNFAEPTFSTNFAGVPADSIPGAD